MSEGADTKGSATALHAVLGLAAGLAWGVSQIVLGGPSASPAAVVHVLGGATGLAFPLVVVLRLARPWPRGFRALLHGAGLVVVPLAVVGAILVDRTHHRALGGLTFAALALAALLVGWLVALRLLPGEPAPEGPSVADRIGKVGLAAVSATAALVVLAALLDSPETRSAAAGLLAVAFATGAPLRRAPRGLGVAAVVVALLLALASLALPTAPLV